MRILMTLTLFMLPMTMGPFYSSNSHALPHSKAQQAILFDTAVIPKDYRSRIDIDEELYSKNGAIERVKPRPANHNVHKVKLMKGKKKSKGMNLLSVLLMLKDKKQ